MHEPKTNAYNDKWTVDKAKSLVEAVRSAGRHVPSRYDMPSDKCDPDQMNKWREAMVDLINQVTFAFTFHEMRPELTKPSWRNQQLRTLASIRYELEQVKSRLLKEPSRSEETSLMQRLDERMPLDYTPIQEFIDAFLDTVDEMKNQVGTEPPLPDTSTTPQAQMLKSLAEAYYRCFEADPRTDMKRTSGSFSGPFVAFVHEALKIEGAPKSDTTLTKALQRAFPSASRGHPT